MKYLIYVLPVTPELIVRDNLGWNLLITRIPITCHTYSNTYCEQ